MSTTLNMSFLQYERIVKINASKLKRMADGPESYIRAWSEPDNDTPAKLFGRATHTMILEPETFDNEYAVYDGRRAGKAYADFVANNSWKEILTRKDMDNISRIREAVASHPIASSLLTGGQPEVTLEWFEEELECKGRIDYLTPGIIVDLKTTTDPSPHKFRADSSKYKTHLSMAHYAAGYESNEGRYPTVFIVAAQNKYPFKVYVYEIPGDVMIRAERQRQRYLQMVRECTKNNHWPDKSLEVHALGIHEYAFDEDELEMMSGGESLLLDDDE